MDAEHGGFARTLDRIPWTPVSLPDLHRSLGMSGVPWQKPGNAPSLSGTSAV
ncbi:hypothetical protein Poly21_31320 [Allorhodopirellula heiligendammensis]|uniref:Uncharacterized protein n=1 Tax=Allorhodopirellula heiligendammensis TaxID=2714739 RepID=A0A5C6BV49_9BACT|nr:hypothetical protein Poly21_31320 [Allorhodopirellula heiligendammensis]